MPLDSDIANADEKLNVEFYTCKLAGQYEGKPFVRICLPGDQTTVIDQPVRDDHRRRFPRQWLYYQMQNTGDGPAIGTPLLDWHRDRPTEFSRSQLDELLVLKFQVVEQVATASDRQLERIGMGGIGLREKARSYLSVRNQSEADRKVAALEAKLAEMSEFMAKMGSPSADKRGPGRPPKDPVNVVNTVTTGSASNG